MALESVRSKQHYLQGVPKTHFHNATGPTVHWLNHQQPTPLVSGNQFFGRFLQRLSRIKPYQVMYQTGSPPHLESRLLQLQPRQLLTFSTWLWICTSGRGLSNSPESHGKIPTPYHWREICLACVLQLVSSFSVALRVNKGYDTSWFIKGSLLKK